MARTKTLAALDRELGRGQRMVGLLDGLAMVQERARRAVGAFRKPARRRRDPDDEETYAGLTRFGLEPRWYGTAVNARPRGTLPRAILNHQNNDVGRMRRE